ncbi:MAG: hypothetical protein ACJA0N_000912 [Pseudohongiellaceae bacterium]|jgi:hypothetical protein
MSNKRPTYHTSFDDYLSSGNLTISNSWHPAASSISAITAMGMQAYTIKTDLRRDFILSCQYRELRNQPWDKLFIDYARERLSPQQAEPPAATQLPSSSTHQSQALRPFSPADDPEGNSSNIITDDWQPSANMMEYILAMVCPNTDYIQAQLVSFTSHYHGKAHANWDQQFKKWINQGWNVYQNKNHFKDDNDKSFVDKHTDTSWSDGL